MNKDRRKDVSRAIRSLDSAIQIANFALYEERFALGNMPENLEGSERYEAMENAVDHLEDAVDSMKDAMRDLEAAID